MRFLNLLEKIFHSLKFQKTHLALKSAFERKIEKKTSLFNPLNESRLTSPESALMTPMKLENHEFYSKLPASFSLHFDFISFESELFQH